MASAKIPQHSPPTLHTGDRMDQPEFHRRYAARTDSVKFELIGGIVFMASPLYRPHGLAHAHLGAVLVVYSSRTPGLEVADNVTTILGPDDEVQPDLQLRVQHSAGGRTQGPPDGHIEGGPELVVEVAHSSRALYMHLKRAAYKKGGVEEYIVACTRERELWWWNLQSERELVPGADGIVRSRRFPGLWLDPAAVFDDDTARSLEVLEQGLAEPAHAAFVAKLRERASG